MVFHRDAYGCQVDDVCTVTGIRDGCVVLDHADGRERRFRPSGNAAHNLGVYETAEIEIRAGDRVRWTRNRKARRRTPALVNGEEARVLGIGPERVRLMAKDGTEYSLARNDPHLRHLDHAWSSTVHGAQGRTAKKVIAVLDAGRMANQEMFYVEVSRASEGFTLLTDDREALIERLETSPDVPDAALEALGEDLDGPIVDPDAWAAVLADWDAVEREASGGPPSSVPGYAEVMARIAAFAAVEDLPVEMRVFVDDRLAAHEATRAAERQVRELIAGLQAQPRRWPELAWAARSADPPAGDSPAWQRWRDEGTALAMSARRQLAGEDSAALSAADRRRLEAALAVLEAVRLKDDAARFGRDWRTLFERSGEDAVPVSFQADHADLARRGAALAQSTGLTADERRAVEAWQAHHAAETALVDDILSAPGKAGLLSGWLRDHVPLDGAGGVDPGDRDVARWRRDADDHLRRMRLLLAADSPHAAHLAAMPVAHDGIVAAARETAESLQALDRAALLWRVGGIVGRARDAGRLPLDLPEWPGTLGGIRDAVDSAAPDDPAGRHLERWLADDARWRDDRSHVASVVGRLKDLERGRPRYTDLPDGDSPDRRAWRKEAEALDGGLETVGALARHERLAHLAACGMTAEAFASLSGALPLMRATDAALVRLGDWSARAHEMLREGGESLTVAPDDVERVGALIEEGRTLPDEWAAAALSRDDMAGAESAVETAVNRLEAALATTACQAFTALCRSVNREMKEGRVHPLDTADYPRLLAALEDLAEREGVPEATLDLMADWREADRRWRKERGQVALLVAEARRLETERTQAADSGGHVSPLSDSWRRDAEVLVADARALAGRERDAHIWALGDDPATLDALLGAIPGWLEADDAVREVAGRADHLRRLRDAARQVLEQPVSGTVPWNGTEPLVRGDRLVWVDERRHDMIVGDPVRPDASGRVGPMLLRPVGADGPGHFRHLFERDVATLIRNPSCARVAWPDESLRAREVERQFPAADATFSLPCDDMVVVGDRIRWTLERPGDALRSRLGRRHAAGRGRRRRLLAPRRLRRRQAGGTEGDPLLGLRISARAWRAHRPADERSLPARLRQGALGGRGPASGQGSRGREGGPGGGDARGASRTSRIRRRARTLHGGRRDGRRSRPRGMVATHDAALYVADSTDCRRSPSRMSVANLVTHAMHVYDRAMERPCCVRPAVPILFFGNLDAWLKSPVRVLTVGLNPSWHEFPDHEPFHRFSAGGRLTRPHAVPLPRRHVRLLSHPSLSWLVQFVRTSAQRHGRELLRGSQVDGSSHRHLLTGRDQSDLERAEQWGPRGAGARRLSALAHAA